MKTNQYVKLVEVSISLKNKLSLKGINDLKRYAEHFSEHGN